MKVVYIVQQVTDECIKRRDNKKNRSFAGLQKSTGMKKMMEDVGYNVKIYSPSIVSNNTKKTFESFYEGDIFHAKVKDLKGINFITSMISIIKELYKNRKEFDMVVYYNFALETSFPAFFCKFFLKKKIFLEYEDGLHKNEGLFGRVYKGLRYLSKKFTNGYILVNESLINELNNKPYMVANGVFDWDLLEKAKKGNLKSEKEKIVISYTGKISDHFGGSELIEYMNNLPVNCELHISGYYWKSTVDVEKYIKDNNLNNIYFYGLLEQKEYDLLLKNTDYFLLLNEGESKYKDTNFPSKLFVYLSSLKPTISTKRLDSFSLNSHCYKTLNDIKKIGNIELKKNETYNLKDIEPIYTEQKNNLKKLLERK